MADNERIEWKFGDINYQQLAPSQANRTQFTPGKRTSRPLDTNWPKDYKIPVGNRTLEPLDEGPVTMERVRVIKLHRNTVSDQMVAPPVSRTVPDKVAPDEQLAGYYYDWETQTQENDGTSERTSGYDWPKD